MPSPGQRTAYTESQVPWPGVGMVGIARHGAAQPDLLRPHAHPWHWELCYLAGGSVRWWVEDQVCPVPADHWYFTRPGERHGAVGAVLEPCRLGWLQVRLAGRGALELPRAEREAIAQTLDRSPRRQARAAPGCWSRWVRLLSDLGAGDAAAQFRARVGVLDLLRQAVTDFAADATVAPSPGIAAVLALLDRDPTRRWTAGELAARAGLGPSRFHERFRAEVGSSPAAYALQLRLHRAQQLLTDGDRPITALALDLGFHSSQHFATAFRQSTGLTPRAWREQTRAEQPASGDAGGRARHA